MKCVRILAGTAIAAALSVTSAQASDRLVELKVVTPETAIEIANATLADCRERGFQVAVAVVDRFGVMQAMIRDRFAGPHTPDTARRKAWTAVSFRADTLELADATKSGQAQSGARDITEALMLGGGVLIQAQGGIVGAVGVSGAPGGEEDDACAKIGIESVAAELEF